MKEDQSQLITARLEHLQFMMDSGKMVIFRHRSDMFLFALEAYNIARGLSSCYYRLQEDLDIRFFIRFRFDYWLNEIQKWIKQLGGAEFHVADENFFAEGRAKRLTIVVNRLFKYHIDKLPDDSANGSMPLPNEEILEPFKSILQMKTTDLVTSFEEALQEVHKYLLRLAMLPVECSKELCNNGLHEYLKDSYNKEHVQSEINNYLYFCRMPDGSTTRGRFCYLKKRLLQLTNNGELDQLNLAKRDQQLLFEKLGMLFGADEFNPCDDELPCSAHLMADKELFAKLLYFVNIDVDSSFPELDENRVFNFLTRKDVFLSVDQEKNLQALFALMNEMKPFFTLVLEKRKKNSNIGSERQKRVERVLTLVSHYNSLLASLVDYNRETTELNEFFKYLFSTEWMEYYGSAQDELLKLFEKDRDQISLKAYIRILRVADDSLHVFKRTTALGKKIYACLKGDSLLKDVTDENTIQTYYSKQGYRMNEENWKQAINLIIAVEKTYKDKKAK